MNCRQGCRVNIVVRYLTWSLPILLRVLLKETCTFWLQQLLQTATDRVRWLTHRPTLPEQPVMQIQWHRDSCLYYATQILRPISFSSQSALNHWVQLTHLVVLLCTILVATLQASTQSRDHRETSFLFQRFSVLIQRFGAIRLYMIVLWRRMRSKASSLFFPCIAQVFFFHGNEVRIRIKNNNIYHFV